MIEEHNYNLMPDDETPPTPPPTVDPERPYPDERG